MTVTYTAVQTASLISVFGLSTVTLQSGSIPVAIGGIFDFAAMIRFQLPPNLYFTSTLDFTLTFSGGGPFGGPLGLLTETYNVVVLRDLNLIPTLVNGSLAANLIPSAAVTYGTGAYYELGTITLTDYSAAVPVSLDLATLTGEMTKNLSYTNPWAGNLLLWIVAEQDDYASVSHIAPLTAYDTLNYANRDTGSRGINSTRWDRCPKTGLKIPRGEMILDGYEKILVHPIAYDPEETESMDWDNLPEENEQF
jgi:hypothetical protein